MPDAGHLIHMATHIDVLCGELSQTSSRGNSRAIVWPTAGLGYEGAENFYTVYPLPQLPLQDLRRDVPRSARTRAGSGRIELVATLPAERYAAGRWQTGSKLFVQ